MAAYLYPEMKSKAAYKRAIATGVVIIAEQPGPFGAGPIQDGRITFEGPHYPKPHTYYGSATVENGKVTKVS